MFVAVQVSYDSKEPNNYGIDIFERNSLDVF